MGFTLRHSALTKITFVSSRTLDSSRELPLELFDSQGPQAVRRQHHKLRIVDLYTVPSTQSLQPTINRDPQRCSPDKIWLHTLRFKRSRATLTW